MIVDGKKLTPKQLTVVKTIVDKVVENDGTGMNEPVVRWMHVARMSSKPSCLMIETVVAPKSYSWDDESVLRTIFVGGRGGVELMNPADENLKGKIKDLEKAISTPVSKL